jgi:hypothetical protein
MSTKTVEIKETFVLTDREIEHRNRSISLYGPHKLFESCLADKTYAIVKEGQRPPKMGMRFLDDGTAVPTGCGVPVSVVKCPEYSIEAPQHDRAVISEHCKSIRCSVCNAYALQRQVERAMLPHQALDEVLKLAGCMLPDSHVGVMPSKRMFTRDMVAAEGVAPLFKWLSGFFSSYNAGLLASTSVLHLYRYKHQDGSDCETRHCTLPHRSEWGPHFHNFGKIFLVPSREIYRDYDGKMIVRKFPDWHGKRDMGATLFYELGHASAVISSRSSRTSQLFRGFGEFSKRRMHRKHIRTDHHPDHCSCPGCMRTLMEYDIDRSEGTGVEVGEPTGFYGRSDEVWEYRFDRFSDLKAVVHSDHVLQNGAYRIQGVDG